MVVGVVVVGAMAPVVVGKRADRDTTFGRRRRRSVEVEVMAGENELAGDLGHGLGELARLLGFDAKLFVDVTVEGALLALLAEFAGRDISGAGGGGDGRLAGADEGVALCGGLGAGMCFAGKGADDVCAAGALIGDILLGRLAEVAHGRLCDVEGAGLAHVGLGVEKGRKALGSRKVLVCHQRVHDADEDGRHRGALGLWAGRACVEPRQGSEERSSQARGAWQGERALLAGRGAGKGIWVEGVVGNDGLKGDGVEGSVVGVRGAGRALGVV